MSISPGLAVLPETLDRLPEWCAEACNGQYDFVVCHPNVRAPKANTKKTFELYAKSETHGNVKAQYESVFSFEHGRGKWETRLASMQSYDIEDEKELKKKLAEAEESAQEAQKARCSTIMRETKEALDHEAAQIRTAAENHRLSENTIQEALAEKNRELTAQKSKLPHPLLLGPQVYLTKEKKHAAPEDNEPSRRQRKRSNKQKAQQERVKGKVKAAERQARLSTTPVVVPRHELPEPALPPHPFERKTQRRPRQVPAMHGIIF